MTPAQSWTPARDGLRALVALLLVMSSGCADCDPGALTFRMELEGVRSLDEAVDTGLLEEEQARWEEEAFFYQRDLDEETPSSAVIGFVGTNRQIHMSVTP